MAKFLENDVDSRSHELREIVLPFNGEYTSFVSQMKDRNIIMENQTSMKISQNKKNNDTIIQEDIH